MKKNNLSVGVFDSGLGGLTVLKALRRLLPYERFVYFGDTARVPYGTKSAETIKRYSSEIVRFLLKKNVKMVVVACNTSSALALKDLQKKFSVPICGVIEPGARLALTKSRVGKIGVIGTEATVRSRAYERAIRKLSGDRPVTICGLATPLLVPLVEEGFTSGRLAEMVIKNYLKKFNLKDIDVLVLGCTHYPMLKKTIRKILDGNIYLVDSAESVALEVRDILTEKNLLASRPPLRPATKFFVTDSPEKFKKLGQKFLGEKISEVKLVRFLDAR